MTGWLNSNRGIPVTPGTYTGIVDFVSFVPFVVTLPLRDG